MLKKDLLLIDIKVKSSRKNINNTHTQDLLYTIKNSFYILRTMKIHFISLVLIGTAYSNLHFEMQKKRLLRLHGGQKWRHFCVVATTGCRGRMPFHCTAIRVQLLTLLRFLQTWWCFSDLPFCIPPRLQFLLLLPLGLRLLWLNVSPTLVWHLGSMRCMSCSLWEMTLLRAHSPCMKGLAKTGKAEAEGERSFPGQF